MESLIAEHMLTGNQISTHLSEMLQIYPHMKDEGYIYPDSEQDQLFEATYSHEGGDTCQKCNRDKAVERDMRRSTAPKIHYGTIGSSNAVVEDGVTRERLREDLEILCVEMLAAGLMDNFPCLVIRGICDYADSHKNKQWQPYAAATAAAYAKELLCYVPAKEIEAASKAADEFRGMSGL